MTTSSVYLFDPSFAGLLDEAAERAGIDPRSLTAEHIQSAKMSLNLFLTQWVARDGDALYRNATSTTSVAASTSTFVLPTGAWDIISDDMMLAYNGATSEIPIARMSREDYLRIPNKTQTGQPNQFYVDRQIINSPTVYLWPIPDAACVFRYDYMRTMQILQTIDQTIDVEILWLDAIASELALRLAKKYNVQRVPLLQGDAMESYRVARRAGSGNSQVSFSFRGFGVSGRTRRR
jgi:hypothetical protein